MINKASIKPYLYFLFALLIFFASIMFIHSKKSWDIDDEYTVSASMGKNTKYLMQYETYDLMYNKKVIEVAKDVFKIGSYNFDSTRNWLLTDTSPPLSYWLFNIYQNIFLKNDEINTGTFS